MHRRRRAGTSRGSCTRSRRARRHRQVSDFHMVFAARSRNGVDSFHALAPSAGSLGERRPGMHPECSELHNHRVVYEPRKLQSASALVVSVATHNTRHAVTSRVPPEFVVDECVLRSYKSIASRSDLFATLRPLVTGLVTRDAHRAASVARGLACERLFPRARRRWCLRVRSSALHSRTALANDRDLPVPSQWRCLRRLSTARWTICLDSLSRQLARLARRPVRLSACLSSRRCSGSGTPVAEVLPRNERTACTEALAHCY